MMRVSGRTSEHIPVIGGVYRFCETYGLPLEVLAFELKKRGKLIDWADYIATALAAGKNSKSLKTQIILTNKEIGTPLPPEQIKKIDILIG